MEGFPEYSHAPPTCVSDWLLCPWSHVCRLPSMSMQHCVSGFLCFVPPPGNIPWGVSFLSPAPLSSHWLHATTLGVFLSLFYRRRSFSVACLSLIHLLYFFGNVLLNLAERGLSARVGPSPTAVNPLPHAAPPSPLLLRSEHVKLCAETEREREGEGEGQNSGCLALPTGHPST